MRGEVWRLEWRVARARRRLFAWNVGVPLLLLAPVAAGAAPAPHRAAVFSVFFVLFAAFGACIPLVRDGAAGWTEKLLLTGYPARAWLAERIAAGAALDAVQLLPAFAVVVAASETRAAWGAGAGGLALALVAGNLLGVLAAVVVRSLAEAALACAASSLAALHLSGAFRPAPPGSVAALVEGFAPFAPLHRGMGALAGSGAPPAAGEWGGPILAAALGVALLLAAAPAACRRLARAPG